MKSHPVSAHRMVVTVLCLLLASVTASAQNTVFLVRHAERADTASGAAPSMTTDPNLSDAGRARAVALASVLRDADITAIFVTEYKRTQETAAPLAKALGITPIAIAARDTGALVERLKQTTGNVLVVAHSNTVPETVKALGVTTPIVIGDDDFDNLLVVTLGQPARMIHLHYR